MRNKTFIFTGLKCIFLIIGTCYMSHSFYWILSACILCLLMCQLFPRWTFLVTFLASHSGFDSYHPLVSSTRTRLATVRRSCLSACMRHSLCRHLKPYYHQYYQWYVEVRVLCLILFSGNCDYIWPFNFTNVLIFQFYYLKTFIKKTFSLV